MKDEVRDPVPSLPRFTHQMSISLYLAGEFNTSRYAVLHIAPKPLHWEMRAPLGGAGAHHHVQVQYGGVLKYLSSTG